MTAHAEHAIETLAIHAGTEVDPATGSLALPIYLSTTFERSADGSYPQGFDYGRGNNPNREDLEHRLAALEGGYGAAAFGSGSAAMMTLIQALQSGDHIVVPNDMYYGIQLMLKDIFGPWGLQVSFVDMTDLDAVRQAIRPQTRLVTTETPSNPMMRITDLAAVAEIAHQVGAVVACDNTVATPIFQRPFEFGVDFALHATTKYIGGHHDVLGGALVARVDSPFWARIRMIQHIGGAVPSPFECWLALRGLMTLPHRMRTHAENAMTVAQFLSTHPKVEKVLYAGLPDHPGHEIAARQMSGFSGMISMLVRGSEADAMRVAANVQVFTRATSFGSPHSLIEHRASIEAPDTKTPRNLLRFSIGLENPDDLIADLQQALSRI